MEVAGGTHVGRQGPGALGHGSVRRVQPGGRLEGELLEERDRWRERAEELDLWAGSDGDRVRVSFDLGGLVTRAPRVLVPIIRALVASPEVDLLSLTDLDRGRAREVLDEVGLGEIPDAALICASWDDGGELCKVEARRAHGIDLHVDDLLPYAQHCDLPDGRPGLGLVLMPSALPYRARSSRDG